MAFRDFLPAQARFTGESAPLARRLRKISAAERREEARAFLETFYAEGGGAEGFKRRWEEVRRELRRHGVYRHTPEELAFGARLAWRNHGRCVGRLFWESLEVFDCRHVTEPDAIAERMVTHMRDATGDGRIRSMISIFAPAGGGRPPAYIDSPQIIQYAGHVTDGGGVLGDRQNVEATRLARALGWRPPAEPGLFDRLPIVIRDADDRRSVHSIPADCVREVGIIHPTEPGIAALGLKWYATPCVSGMILTIGGLDYPCAPFNGFYMCTEIASRNFADRKRYDLLPKIAVALGLDTGAGRSPLWRDRTLTELNVAVMHSFRTAGVTMIDHHAASDQFMEFHQREQASGRRVAADWRWITPPQASAACEVFHLRMRNFHPVPNYYSARALDGIRLMPFYGDRPRNLWSRSVDRVRRRWKLWRRMAW